MTDWDKELEKILQDPLFDDVTAPKQRTTRSDRLKAGFMEICDFCKKNGRQPEDSGGPEERRLFNMLKGIRADKEKKERCRQFDEFGLLADAEPDMEAILDDPLFDDVTSGSGSIFDIPEYMRTRLAARKEAEYIGRRRPCDDFGRFAAGFAEVHAGLKTGRYRLAKFKAANLIVGSYFVEDGVMGYLAAFDCEGKNSKGSLDGRTRVVYENGSEADIKFQTIVKNLAVDGYSVQDTTGMTDEETRRHFSVDANDVESGTIYVLRSKSAKPEIASIKHLYKIGFTTTSVESRVANARHEPTYLCADIEVVATWRVYNVKSSTLESLIHRLFAAAQLQVSVDGRKPKEWYIVPLPIIRQAIGYIIAGTPVAYDSALQKLVILMKNEE